MRSMLISWKDEYTLNIPIIDEQHRGIVAEINSVFYLLTQCGDPEILADMIEIIILKTKVHFAVEERLMARSNYPEYERHVEQHRELSTQLHSVSVLDQVMENPMEFLTFLKDWWINHILEEDGKYAPHVEKYLQCEK